MNKNEVIFVETQSNNEYGISKQTRKILITTWVLLIENFTLTLGRSQLAEISKSQEEKTINIFLVESNKTKKDIEINVEPK